MNPHRYEVMTYVMNKFAQGKGAELVLHRRGQRKRLLLIPSPVFSESAERGLAIALEDEGFHFWNGLNPLNGFDLCASGFSLNVADAIAVLVRDLFPYRLRRKLQRSQEHNPMGASPQIEDKPNE